MGEVKTDMERATAPKIREGNRPPSVTQVHDDNVTEEENDTATVAHAEPEEYHEEDENVPWTEDSMNGRDESGDQDEHGHGKNASSLVQLGLPAQPSVRPPSRPSSLAESKPGGPEEDEDDEDDHWGTHEDD